MTYIISHPKIELEIKLERVDRLHIHEEIIPSVVEQLSKDVKKDGHVKHPIIVDKKTLVVLDGMHRVAVIEHLGYELIPVCLVDYENPNIIVGSWFRTVEDKEKDIVETIKQLGHELEECTIDEAKEKISRREAATGVITSEKCYAILKEVESLKEAYEFIKKLEQELSSAGYKIGYNTEKDAIDSVKSGEILATIIAPRITKKDVVEVALAGEVFVHKTTRHIIPARPLFVNIPLEWLNMDQEEANKLVYEHLSKRKLKHLPPGQILDRRYEEELYVFE